MYFNELNIFIAQANTSSFIFLQPSFWGYKWGIETGQAEFIKSIVVKQHYRPDPFITVPLYEWRRVCECVGVWVHAREDERVVSGLTNDDWRQGLNLWRQQSYRKRSLVRNKLLLSRSARVRDTRQKCPGGNMFLFTQCILLLFCFQFSVDASLHVCPDKVTRQRRVV